MRLLILGGTSEARRLADEMARRPEVETIFSFAGRTERPAPQAVATRIGGFGGIDGLVDYLRAERIDRVIDATHPFAAQMSRHAVEACARAGIPLLTFSRAPWRPQAGDRWTEVESNGAAAEALGAAPRRVFLTIGRLGLMDFAGAPQHVYLIRTIDPPGDLSFLPQHELILARGPFTVDDEIETMRRAQIDVVVSKNSGGGSTEAKLDAARALGLPVIMVRRPATSGARITHDLAEALAFACGHDRSPAERGV